MLRLSKAEREKTLRELMMSDDDDDFFDKLPKGLSKKASSPISSSSSSVPVSASSAEIKRQSPRNDKENEIDIEARAQQKAKAAGLNLVRDINDPSLLRFHKFKNIYAPCCIRTNHDEAQNLVNITAKNDTLIRYLGYNSPDMNQISAVPAKALIPYHNNEGDETRWSSDLMDKFKESMRKKTKFKNDTAILLRAEEIALQRMLEQVIRNHDLQEQNHPPPPSPLSSDDQSNAAESSPVPAWSGQSPDALDPPPAKRASTYEIDYLNEGPKQKLRAGDVIKYHANGMVASRENLRSATIVEVHPRPSDVALVLDTGEFLLHDDRAALVKRRLRNKLQDNPNVRMQGLGDYQLDKSANGKFHIVTKAQKLQKMYKDARATIVEDAEKAVFQQSKDSTQSTAPDSDSDVSMYDSKPAATKKPTEQLAASLKPPQQPLPMDSHEKHVAKISEKNQSKMVKSAPSANPDLLSDRTDNDSNRPATTKRSALTSSKAPILSSKRASPKKKRKITKPSWQDKLNFLLEKVCAERNRTRYDKNSVNTREASLCMAMKVRARLEQLSEKEIKTEDELVADIAEVFDVPVQRLWSYLEGNDRNLLTLEKLDELTEKWKEWLPEGIIDSSDTSY